MNKQIAMKGVMILTDEKKKRKILQVDIKEIAKNPGEFEDLIDVLVAESRKDEKKSRGKMLKNNWRMPESCNNSICKYLFYAWFFWCPQY